MNRHCPKCKFKVTLKSQSPQKSDINNTFDIREKRIGIVFKVIYVLAIFFATLFLDIAKSFGKGLTNAYIVEACTASFLMVIIIYTVSYIINEMKCLKLNEPSQKQINLTEQSYENIFINLYVSGFTSLLCIFIAIYKFDSINIDLIAKIFIINFFAYIALFSIRIQTKNKLAIILQGASCVAVTMIVISILLLPTLNIPTSA